MTRFYSDVLFFSFFFSVVFCIFCSLVDNLLSFWIFLELCGLSLIPSFFYVSKSSIHGFYSSLLSYIIMSGVSSVLIVSGLLFIDLYYFVLFGFIMKFGLFPFSLWIYHVFAESSWIFIFFLSVILKFPILFFCFLLKVESFAFIYIDCFLTIMMCSLFFWFFSNIWEYIWCHISLSSLSTLMVACFCSDVWNCLYIYIYYFVWGSLCICFFMKMSDWRSIGGSFFWLYCFLFLVTPISFPLFYKLMVCVAIFYSSFYVLFSWCIYSFSEQIFLFKLGSDYFYSNIFNNWLS